MNYIVFDLEFNQGYNRTLNKTVSNEKCPFEIIQIGAIKLDENFNILDTFNTYIKPSIYCEIHPFIKKMTGINESNIMNAPKFIQAFKKFENFISEKNSIFCVWGSADLKELYRNIIYHDLSSKSLPKLFINVQQHASKFFNNPNGKSIGLQNAIEQLNISEDKSYHDALNDAYYTSQVFIRINSPDIVPQVYMHALVKSKKINKNNKSIINYDKLFNEIKKLSNRDLSKEDKKLISLAYKMGKNNQFSIDIPIKKK